MANFDVVDLDKLLDDFEDDLDGEEEAKNGIGIQCWTPEAQGISATIVRNCPMKIRGD